MRKIWAYICLMIMTFIFTVPFFTLKDIEIVEATYLTETEYCPAVEVNGTIESGKAIPVSLSYPVFIKEQFVFENDFVNKGQLLFTLDTEKMKSAVKSSDLSVYAEAYSSLDKSVFMSISDKIYASESGYITQIAAYEGSVVLSDENLCVINTEDDLMLKITINQEDYSKISVGDKLEFSPLIMPLSVYNGQISNKTANLRKQTSLTGSKTVVDLYATIDNVDEKLVDGLQFSGKVYKNNKDIIMMLPYEYLNQDDEGEYLNIYSANGVQKVYVETGTENKDYIEILTPFENSTLFLKNDYSGKKRIIIRYGVQ